MATSRRQERVDELIERYDVRATTSNAEAVSGAAIVVVAKPQDIEALLGEIGGLLGEEQTVLSIARRSRSAIEGHLLARGACGPGDAEYASTVLRASRRPAGPRRDAPRPRRRSCASAGLRPTRTDGRRHGRLRLRPPYFALLAEAMIEAGILLGLARSRPSSWCRRCSAPRNAAPRHRHAPGRASRDGHLLGGTTIAAIRVLEMAGVRAAFLNAIQAAMDRSKELAAGEQR